MNDQFLENTAAPEAAQPPCVVPNSNPESALIYPRKKDPLADGAPSQRPGVTNRTLRDNGIELLSNPPFGLRLRIPYFKPREETARRTPIRDGHGNFYRERRINAVGDQPKYHQPKETFSHAYFPNGSFDLINEQGIMIVTEGEFKALSLVEGGHPAVAIGGINNFTAGDTLVPELEFLFTQCGPVVLFLGDADTALNPQFAHAAIKFQKLVVAKLPHTIFKLPRMALADLDRMKGIDDARDELGNEGFEPFFNELLKNALVLEHGTCAEDLVFELIKREEAGLNILVQKSSEHDRQKFLTKLTRVATACGPNRGERVAEMAVVSGLVKSISLFKREQKVQARKDAGKRSEATVKISPEMYYYPKGAKNYLYRTSDGSYTPVDRRGATNHLVKCGFMCKNCGENSLSETDCFLTDLDAQPMDWVGPLAGRKSGMHRINQKRILVTTSPTLVTPVQGEYPLIRAFVNGLLDYDPATDPNPSKKSDEPVNQSCVFFSWLAFAVRDLYDGGKFCPAQALVLAGPKRVGKNVCQDIITQCLGGRHASPFSAMVGETAFNGELLGAEHWMIADEQHGNGYAEKQKLQSAIKKFCVNQSLSFNAKYSEAISLDPYRRLTISLNDDAESLRVLPDLTENSADKLMILHAFGKPFHGDGTSFDCFGDWWKVVLCELPALIYDLINNFKIPGELQDRHYRVVSYHNEDLVEALQSTKPETAFAEIVLRWLTPQMHIHGTAPWRGTARALIDALKERGCREIDGVDHYNKPFHVGCYLSALCRAKPESFCRGGVVDGYATYFIGARLPPGSRQPLPGELPPPLPPTETICPGPDLPPPLPPE